MADPILEPHKYARQTCWMIRTDNGQCDDRGHGSTCEGATLTCPAGWVLGSECPGNPFKDPGTPDAGTN